MSTNIMFYEVICDGRITTMVFHNVFKEKLLASEHNFSYFLQKCVSCTFTLNQKGAQHLL